MIKDICKLVRPSQWVKNGFVFLPMFFAGQLSNLICWREAIIGFISFSFAASAIYCLNDIRDVEEDRLHPVKRHRPIASGSIPVVAGWLICITLALCSVLVCCVLGYPTGYKAAIIILIYIMINIAYCLRLKRLAIIDVVIVSFGFVLRIVLGGVVTSIWISPWIVLLTFLLTLFLAISKRRDDVILLNRDGIARRRNIRQYNLEFLNQALSIIGAVTIVCYIMYCVSPEVILRFKTEYLYITAVFVLTGILRYLQIAIVDSKSGSPTRILLKDRFIQFTIIAWIFTFVVILYI